MTPGSKSSRRHRNTIRDVAEAAGVSISTVSKALNDGGRMRQETRDHIRAVAERMGFRPNDLALSLHRNQSLTVGIISTDRFGRFTLPIVEAMEETFAGHGIAIFMCNATDDPALERQHIDQLLGKRVDGIVVTARRADRRPPIGVPPGLVPIIYVFSQADDPKTVSLLPDDEGGAKLAVEHLLRLGRRRIAHVTGPEHFEAVRLRHAGYRKALRTAGVSAPASLFLSGHWREGWGREATGLLFNGATPAPDAIFCGNDQIARGACDALRERGIGVPGDVSIIGFDNWDIMTEASRPPLTSVDMNLTTLGREAGQLMMNMIGGSTFTGVRRLPCTLVFRESCGVGKFAKEA